MSDRKDFQLFDNYEEDGQLSLFNADYDDWDEDWTEDVAEEKKAAVDVSNIEEEKAATGVATVAGKKPVASAEVLLAAAAENSNTDIRVRYCACCGKLLFVREETAGFRSECNNCGVKYFQRF